MKGLVCKLPRWLITLAAALAIGLSVSAHIIGFDNNPVWGPRRIALLLFGMLALLLVHRTLLQRGARRWLGWLGLPTLIAGFEFELVEEENLPIGLVQPTLRAEG